MGAPSDFSRAPWRLKVARAQKHLVELEEQIRIYSDTRPYQIRWERVPKGQSRTWRAVLRITRQPDEELSIILGDVVHNLRTSLDHLAGALVPRSRASKTSFPIVSVDPWKTGTDGHLLAKHREARERFGQAIDRMRPEAAAIIKDLQPYSDWSIKNGTLRLILCVVDSIGTPTPIRKISPGVHPDSHVLSILSRLDNADKHRNLIAVATHLPSGTAIVKYPTEGDVEFPILGPCEDGTPIISAKRRTSTFDHPEVEVKVDEPIMIMVRVGFPPLGADVIQILRGIAWEIPAVVFPLLEPWVQSWPPPQG